VSIFFRNMPSENKPKSFVLGLRHESKSEHEHRVPLVPSDLKTLIADHNVSLLIQPSPTRCIPIEEFTNLGARVDADMSSCDVILGIKEVPKSELIPDKAFCFFSHVIKGQPHNMPLLQRMINLKCTLLDYERLVNDNNVRLVAFGKQAGQCGAINAFHSLNHRLATLGQPNPFERCKQALNYPDFPSAKADLKAMGEAILKDGLPQVLVPFVVAVTGRGNVASGVFDILGAIPCVVEWTTTELMENIQAGRFDFHHIYKVVLDAGDLYELKENPNPAAFTWADFSRDPGAYTSPVPRFLPHFSLFINAVFWKEEFPRFIPKETMKDLWQQNHLRLIVIADITCDLGGSVQMTSKSTLPDMPSYVYNPITETVTDGFAGEGVVIMAVDILPAEQPLESSNAFSKVLMPLMPALVSADFNTPTFADLRLDPVWRRACIVYRGALTPDYEYLQAALTLHGNDK
jgi:alanine dehydrogenase